jgi:hypothetical protein
MSTTSKRKRRKKKKRQELTERDIKELMRHDSYEKRSGVIRQIRWGR